MSAAPTEKSGAAGPSRTGWEQRPETSAPPSTPSAAIAQAMAILTELREFLAYYVAVRLDAVRRTVRQMGILAGIGVIGGIVLASMLVVAVVLLLLGISGAFAALLPHQPWLGDIITAVIFLVLPVIGLRVGMRMLTRTFKTSMVNKYEERQRRQREQFGRDVRDEAAASRGSSGTTH